MEVEDIKNIKINPKYIFTGLLIAVPIFLMLIFNPFITVGAGERGVILTWGAVGDKTLNEGLHFIVPYMQRVEIVDVKIQKAKTDADASSKDLQTVSSTVAINYHIIPEKANVVYQSIGTQFKERIIDPAVQEIVKAVTARYTAEELITKRSEVSVAMKQDLAKKLLENNIAVDEFSIVNFSFSKAYQEEVEAKQVAEQRVKKATLELRRIEIEKEQKITQAEAEAKSLSLQKQEITPDLIKLRQIEATMKAIEKWNGVLPNVTGGAVPFVDVKNYGGARAK